MSSTNIPKDNSSTCPQIGILLANTGSPDAPTPGAVKSFLHEFLSDPRVIDYPRSIWLPILNGIILNVRPRRSAHLYQQIWTHEGSPLIVIAQEQAKQLRATLAAQTNIHIEIAYGMRYGNPSIPQALNTLKDQGVNRVLVFPMFPQYSGTTTGSVMDTVQTVFASWDEPFEMQAISDYHDHPAYIHALASNVKRHWSENGKEARLLLSFHGIPNRYAEGGDPYNEQCLKTSFLLAEALGLENDTWQVAFQSRFGPETWLQPYTDNTLIAWGKEGLSKVSVICPGFSTDCLETRYEIDIEARENFLKAGGEAFEYIPALNDHPDHIRMLSEIIIAKIEDWIELSKTGKIPSINEYKNKDAKYA